MLYSPVMTFAQIGAILALLMAFGVDQPIVDKIAIILTPVTPQIVQIPIGSVVKPPVPITQPPVQSISPPPPSPIAPAVEKPALVPVVLAEPKVFTPILSVT